MAATALGAAFGAAVIAPGAASRPPSGGDRTPPRVQRSAAAAPQAEAAALETAAASGPRTLRTLRLGPRTLRAHGLVPVQVGELPRSDPNDGTTLLTEPFQAAGGRQALGPRLRRLGWISGHAQFLARRDGANVIVQAYLFRDGDGAAAAARILHDAERDAQVDPRAGAAWRIDSVGRSQEVGWVRGRFLLLVEVSSVRLGARAAQDLRDRLFPVLDDPARALTPAAVTDLAQAGVAPARLRPDRAAALGLVAEPGDAGRRGRGQVFRRRGAHPVHVRIRTWAFYGRAQAQAAFGALQADAGASPDATRRGLSRYQVGPTTLQQDWVEGPYVLRVTVTGEGLARPHDAGRPLVDGAALLDAVSAALDADLRRRPEPTGTV